MAEFPADATVDTAAPAEPMQLAQIEEKKPAEFKGFLSMGWMPKAVCLSLQNFGNNWALPLPFALLRMFCPVLYPDEVWKEISERIKASLFDEKMQQGAKRTMSSA